MTNGRPLNCWDIRQCGREIGGERAARLGVCPAAMETRLNGINRGRNAGRACWAVAGTFCGSESTGQPGPDQGCEKCEVYSRVQAEEAHRFVGSALVLALIR
ncbi:MAG: hypothetical protein P1V51_07210 [Deltaproteobacteria bacterium]|nr:hypothetical protein [Deltaproteobacteria bacterium]